jgi:hypothetical protein
LIDEGKVENFKFNEDQILTDLPENYSDYKPNVKCCFLNDRNKTWSSETTSYFKKLVSKKDRLFYLKKLIICTQASNEAEEMEDVYSVDFYYL